MAGDASGTRGGDKSPWYRDGLRFEHGHVLDDALHARGDEHREWIGFHPTRGLEEGGAGGGGRRESFRDGLRTDDLTATFGAKTSPRVTRSTPANTTIRRTGRRRRRERGGGGRFAVRESPRRSMSALTLVTASTPR